MTGRVGEIRINSHSTAANLAERAAALFEFRGRAKQLTLEGCRITPAESQMSLTQMGVKEGSLVYVTEHVRASPATQLA